MLSKFDSIQLGSASIEQQGRPSSSACSLAGSPRVARSGQATARGAHAQLAAARSGQATARGAQAQLAAAAGRPARACGPSQQPSHSRSAQQAERGHRSAPGPWGQATCTHLRPSACTTQWTFSVSYLLFFSCMLIF